MPDEPELTPDIEAVLKRYAKLQQEERQLKEEKGQLQERLYAHLRGFPDTCWTPTVTGRRMRVSHKELTEIDYDEALLAGRLGERYREILSPDLKKLRKKLPKVASCLEPVLDEIGSPDSEKIRDGLQSGAFTMDDFQGTFEKATRHRVTVIMMKD